MNSTQRIQRKEFNATNSTQHPRRHQRQQRQQYGGGKRQEYGLAEQGKAHIARQLSDAQLFQPRKYRGKYHERKENRQHPTYHAELSEKIAACPTRPHK